MPRPLDSERSSAAWVRPLLCTAAVFACVVDHAWAADANAREARAASRALVKAVNAVVESAIAIDAAQSTACAESRLPGSLPKLLPLLPSTHRDLIGECVRGRIRLQRDQAGFDLVGAIEEPVDRPSSIATIRAFFDGRAVDVATGSGLSAGPYPISFDWVVVLDSRSQTLYSFVFNCID